MTEISSNEVIVAVHKRPRTKRQPPFGVVIYNDDQHTFAYVTELLIRVFGHPRPRAFELTCQVHYSGQAIAWSGSLEVAELKRDQVQGFGPDFHGERPVRFPLGVTVEPMPGE